MKEKAEARDDKKRLEDEKVKEKIFFIDINKYSVLNPRTFVFARTIFRWFITLHLIIAIDHRKIFWS